MVMFMKNRLKILFIILGIIVVLGLIFFAIDYNRVKKQEKPIFCVNTTTYRDGGTKEYLGLGYKVIDFHTLEGYDDIKIGTCFMQYNDFDEEMKRYETKFEEESQKNDYNIRNDVFNARIKEIRKYNGITTVLIEGIESNDINHRGEFSFSVDNDTELLWKETKIELSSLKESQYVSITSIGDVLEKYPAVLTKVIKVIVLDEKL